MTWRSVAVLFFALLAACSRTEQVQPRTAALPATCDRVQFQAAVDQFEAVADRRDEILGRADKYPEAEPAEYLRSFEKDLAEYRELAAQAEAISTPRCLRAAREIFAGYLEKSEAALEARRPGTDSSIYRQRRETADTIYAQFKTEVGQQRKNAP